MVTKVNCGRLSSVRLLRFKDITFLMWECMMEKCEILGCTNNAMKMYQLASETNLGSAILASTGWSPKSKSAGQVSDTMTDYGLAKISIILH